MDKINNRFASIQQVTDQYLKQGSTASTSKTTDGLSFEEILQQKQSATEISELKFSKHASQRLEDRNIDLSQEQMERLESGAQMAGDKGIKESLIMVDSMAFIVNIPNNTVITAIDQNEATNNVFTNIDGAVVI